MALPIVLIVGQAGSGKDTFGKMLCDHAGFKRVALADPLKMIAKEVFGFTDEQLWGPSEKRNEIDSDYAPGGGKHTRLQLPLVLHDQLFGRYSFDHEGVIRQFMCDIRDYTLANNGLSARYALQQLGTEVGRKISPTFWIDKTIASAQLELDTFVPGIVITDGRFLNEIKAIKAAGGVVIKLQSTSSLTNELHVSETEIDRIPSTWFDLYINNDKDRGVEELRQKAEWFYTKFFSPRII